jgi:hypothetical protein
VFAKLKQIVLEAYDRVVGLVLDEISVDGCITKAPGGGQSPDVPQWIAVSRA